MTIRGQQVLLDSDVAKLYGYETMRINETARRNIKRFPAEFRFQLTQNEYDNIIKTSPITSFDSTDNQDLISQVAISSGSGNVKHGGRRKLPFVFTEPGIGMLSGLLRNDTAIQVSIGIMDAFVEMRKFLNANQDVFANMVHVNNKLLEHDNKFDEVFDLLQQRYSSDPNPNHT